MAELWIRVESDDKNEGAGAYKLSCFSLLSISEGKNGKWELKGREASDWNVFQILSEGTRQHVNDQFQRIMAALAKMGQVLDLAEPPDFEPLVPPVDLRTSKDSFETRIAEFETSEGDHWAASLAGAAEAFAQFKTPSAAQTPPAKPES